MFSYSINDHLRLSLPEPRHADKLTSLVQRNLEHLQPWMPWAVDDYSAEHALRWVGQVLNEFAQNGQFNALIILDEEIVGTIGFHALDTQNQHAQIGYWIDKDHQGKGLVSKCCRVLIDYLFDTMNLNRVQINCNVENIRSRAIPERLGFTHEGTIRHAEKIKGRFGDWAIYGLLRDEWKDAR